MGGYLSSQPAATVQSESSQMSTKQESNNNKADVVVIPVDGSEQSQMAFQWYLNHVHRPTNKLRIVHCIQIEHPDGENYPDYAVPPEAFDEMQAKSRKVTESLVDKYRNLLASSQVEGSVEAISGHPGETVINSIKKHNGTMVIMGSRGLGLIRRTVLGSVSEYVLHHTTVPITIIPKHEKHSALW